MDPKVDLILENVSIISFSCEMSHMKAVNLPLYDSGWVWNISDACCVNNKV